MREALKENGFLKYPTQTTEVPNIPLPASAFSYVVQLISEEIQMIDSYLEGAPTVEFLPMWGKIGAEMNPLLRCESGWNEDSTRAFLKNNFTNLWLTFRADQRMDIPPLGEKALCVRKLHMVGSGIVAGLEQFRDVEVISISSFPKNGINFSSFAKLRHVSTVWNKKYIEDVFSCDTLSGLDIDEGFADEDCQRYQALPLLTYVGFTYGKIRSLKGLDACTQLKSLGLAYCRNFSDLDDLTKFAHLETLSLTNLPRLKWDLQLHALKTLRNLYFEKVPAVTGRIDLRGLKLLEEINIVGCPDASVDLSSIGEMSNLKMLWINIPHVALDLDALFSRPRLRLCGLYEDGRLADSDEELLRLAAKHNRKIANIERVGAKKTRQRHIRIEFQDCLDQAQ